VLLSAAAAGHRGVLDDDKGAVTNRLILAIAATVALA
jgi:hypothetical protein